MHNTYLILGLYHNANSRFNIHISSQNTRPATRTWCRKTLPCSPFFWPYTSYLSPPSLRFLILLSLTTRPPGALPLLRLLSEGGEDPCPLPFSPLTVIPGGDQDCKNDQARHSDDSCHDRSFFKTRLSSKALLLKLFLLQYPRADEHGDHHHSRRCGYTHCGHA